MISHAELIGIDTNVLLAAYAPGDHPHRAPARQFLSSLGGDRRGFVSHVVICEFFHALKRTFGIPKADCLARINDLVMAPAFELEDGESIIYALERAEAGADFPDALIAVTHELFGTERTVTFDQRAASAFGWQLLA